MPQMRYRHWRTLTLVVLSLAVGSACNHPIDRASSDPPSSTPADARHDYERHIRRLSAKARPADSTASWRALKAAGTDAFPALIAHFRDRAIAAESLQGATLNPSTVGDACFDLIQMQIEGAWPKSLEDFHVLTPENTREWLAAHAGLTLDEMRRVASERAVARAEAALAAEPSKRSLQKAVAYLKERNRELATGPESR
ncbi:MAG TPA: hypothetical protein VGR35_04325 [Tepidisphaeraceae bacterium]|nr:hypothetical protein [Tepidisphaeraceae bacterium]